MKNDKQNDRKWVEAQKIALNLSGFKNLPSKSYKPLSKQGGGKVQQILSIGQGFYFPDYLKSEPIILSIMSVRVSLNQSSLFTKKCTYL